MHRPGKILGAGDVDRLTIQNHRGWEALESANVILKSQPNLLEVVLARHSSCGFASCLDCWQQQTDQDANDRDHHQQFHQGKGFSFCSI